MEKLKKVQLLEKRYGGILLYFILIPFLHPRGFSEYFALYKGFFTAWLLLAMLAILAWLLFDLVCRGFHFGICDYAAVAYYALLIGITFILQRGFGDGLQKMFAVPALYLFCLMQLKRDSKRFLETLVNILLVVLTLNVTLFMPPVMDKLIGLYHVNFLGHVQISAQFGVLGIFLAYLLLKLRRDFSRESLLLLVVSVLSILWAQTFVGYLVLVILTFGAAIACINKLKRLNKLLLADFRVYFWGGLVLSALLVAFSLTELDVALRSNLLSLNGRTFIWRDALARMAEAPIFGYGAFGVLIKTFWSVGMNYAHNDLVQHMLDGGIVLTVAFYGMLYIFLSCGRQIKSSQIRSTTNLFLITMFAIMLVESATEYFYVHIFFCLVASMPIIETDPRHLQNTRDLKMLLSFSQLKEEFIK